MASSFGRAELWATVVGTLLGGIVGGLVLYAAAPAHLVLIGSVVGTTSVSGGFLAWLGLALVLGFGFAYVVGQTINDYVASVIALTSSNPGLRRAIQPMLSRSALGTTAGGMGLVYGIVAGIVVGLLLVPAAVGAVTTYTPDVPGTNATVVLAYTLYGLVMGAAYGATLEGSLPLLSSSSTASSDGKGSATLAGWLAGGVVSGLVLYQLATSHLLLLAGIASGVPSEISTTRGFAVWLALALVLAVLYRFTAALAISRGPDFLRDSAGAGLVFGVVAAVVFGILLTPLVVNETTGFTVEFPLVSGSVILAYLVFGVVAGVTYAGVLERSRSRSERAGRESSRGERTGRESGSVLGGRVSGKGVVAGALVGGIVGGGYLYYAQPLHLRFVGTIAGSGTPTRGFIAFLVMALVLGGLLALITGDLLRRWGLVVGAVFGFLVAVVVGLLAVPLAVNETSRFTLRVPLGNEKVMAGYFLYGLLFALTYARVASPEPTVETPTAAESGFVSDTGRKRGAALFGGLFGGLAGGLVVHHLARPVYIRYVGSIVGFGGIVRAWLVWLVLSVLLAAVFALLVSDDLEGYVNSVINTTAQNDTLRGLLQPALRRAALTTTATGLGLLYGIAVAVIVGMVGIPVLVAAVTPFSLELPATQYVLGFIVYGTVLGAGYGVIVEF